MMTNAQPLIGVLGGMGPLATVDFMHKLVEEMPAGTDQEHVPVVARNVAQIPDRQKALAGTGESPLPALLEGVRQLVAAGASRLVIPCNTAHYWLPQLSADCPVPFISIIDATLNVLKGGKPAAAETIGLIATRGTLLAGLYQQRLADEDMPCLCNTEEEMETLFTPGCYAVKRGEVDAGGRLLEAAAEALLARGATRLVLACTEVPVALERVASRHLPLCVDTNRALARACVDYWQQVRPR
jgi:aspartate racemase